MKTNIHQVFTMIIEIRNDFFANIFAESADCSSNLPFKFYNGSWVILVNLELDVFLWEEITRNEITCFWRSILVTVKRNRQAWADLNAVSHYRNIRLRSNFNFDWVFFFFLVTTEPIYSYFCTNLRTVVVARAWLRPNIARNFWTVPTRHSPCL